MRWDRWLVWVVVLLSVAVVGKKLFLEDLDMSGTDESRHNAPAEALQVITAGPGCGITLRSSNDTLPATFLHLHYATDEDGSRDFVVLVDGDTVRAEVPTTFRWALASRIRQQDLRVRFIRNTWHAYLPQKDDGTRSRRIREVACDELNGIGMLYRYIPWTSKGQISVNWEFYNEPSTDSPMWSWSRADQRANGSTDERRRFSPRIRNEYAGVYLAVVDSVDGWYQVETDSRLGELGWYRADTSTVFLDWEAYLKKRAYVQWDDENVRLQPRFDALKFGLVYKPGEIDLAIVREVQGDWARVQTLRDEYAEQVGMDPDKPPFSGWVRWRSGAAVYVNPVFY